MSNENQEKQNLVYLILFDKETGERRASYAVGVHADTMEELREIVDNTPEYDGLLRIEDDGAIQNKTADGSHLYLNGELIEKPPYVPTVEEVQAAQIRALDAKYEPLITELENEIMKSVLVYQDEDYAQELRDELKATKAQYASEREALTNGK